MTLPIGATVRIGRNRVHPHLAGTTGVLVAFTQPERKHPMTNPRAKKSAHGGNPIVEIAEKGRFLVPVACLKVVGE